MGQLVFQATLGGQVNLVGPNTASTYNINVPAVAGNMVTTGDTGTVTSTMLASSLSLTTPNINVATGTSLKVTSGFYSTSSSSFTYTDGIVMDYTTGLGRISVGTSDGLAFYNAGVATTELMRLDSSGNLGIGTNSPTSIAGYASLTVNGTTSGLLSVKYNGTDGGYIYTDSSSFSFDSKAATPNLVFKSNGGEKMRIDSSGNVLVTNPAGLGYGTGSGGTVTQATSKSTAVTLNKPTGQITMNNAALAAGALVTFTLNNSLIASTDIVNLTFSSGFSSGAYNAWISFIGTGSAAITVKNISAGSLSEAGVINFAIIKGAVA